MTKEYGKRKILDNVNLTLNEGDILGIIGQSGSGKTTLLNLFAGFIEPTDGTINVKLKPTDEPKDLHKHLSKIKSHIGFTPQHNSFYHKLTVEENLLHFGRLYKVPMDRLKTNIKNLLNFTRLIDFKDMLADNLSGGMQKRLDISCSLIHKPKILVLDEPTADLDPILQKEIIHLLKEVNKQGISIVIASHHLDSIEHLCNKVAIVHNGQVHTSGAMKEVQKPFFKDHITINVHPGEEKEHLIERLKTLPIKKIVDKGRKLVVYPKHVEKTITDLITIIKEENLYLHEMDMRRPSLNEVFEKIVLAKK